MALILTYNKENISFSLYKKTGFENRTYESIVNELFSDQNFLNYDN